MVWNLKSKGLMLYFSFSCGQSDYCVCTWEGSESVTRLDIGEQTLQIASCYKKL